MRLAGKEKGGFYPTPPLGLAQIVRHIVYPPAHRVRLLDPCAGKAEAILYAALPAPIAANVDLLVVENSASHEWDIANNLRYGLQYGPNRTRSYPHQTLFCAWEEVVLSQESVGLLWLNPPYDFEAIKVESDDPSKVGRLVTERVEYTFLKSSTPKLQPGGLLIYIAPLSLIQRTQVLRYLATHYEAFRMRSLPDPEYELFDQVVLFARKKKIAEPNADALAWLTEQVAERPTALSDEDDFTYNIPTAPEKLVFRKNQLTYEETARLIAQHGAQFEPVWQEWATPKTQAKFRPAGPPKLGHVATFITSGMFGVVNLGTSVIRGAATKRTLAYDKFGNHVPVNSTAAIELRERYDTEIYRIFADGEYKVLSKPEELEELLRDHVGLLHAMVLRQYSPLYNGDPTRAEWEALAGLMSKKKLPGRKSAGLLLAQKHAVVTMARVLQALHYGFLIADMGCGKGPMGYGVAHAINGFPLLVICPPHLVEKHAREAKDTLGAGIKTVIVTKASELFKAVDEHEPGQKLVVIAGITTWSLGPGVHRVRVMKQVIEKKRDPETGVFLGWEAVKREVCPRCGQVVDSKLSASNKPVKCENKKCREPLYEYGSSPKQYAKTKQKFGKAWSYRNWAEANPHERAQQRRTSIHRWPLATVLSKKVRKGFFKMLIADEMHKFKAKGTDRGYAFQRLTNAVRYVLNTTGTIFGGYASDLFYLMYRTMPSFRREFGFDDVGKFVDMYGKRKYTLTKEDDDYGVSTGKRRRIANVKDLPGISPSVYPLLLKAALFMRVADLGYELPTYTEEMPMVVMEGALLEQYAWLHETLYQEIHDKLSSFNGPDMREALGLLSTWLVNTLYRPQSAFRSEIVMRPSPLNNKDAGIHLQVPYRVDPGDSESYGYTARADQVQIVELGLDESELEMSEDITTQDVRGKPAAAVEFDANHDDSEAMVLYPAVPVGELLPKEQWLTEEAPRQVRAGNKVLLYVEQTAKRNIQRRLKRLLDKTGLRVLILPDGNAREREAWIARRVGDIDVLITNPRKVETGLDLIQFSTLIFYELPTSLFTLQQAMKRVWRLGQIKDVLVLIPHHVGYEALMERRIIGLMAEKVKSAALLYGENASSAFADEATGGDITADIAKQIMAEAAGAAPERFADGIKSLLGDLVAEELAVAAAARQAAIDAGEESAGTGELEEEEAAEFDIMFAEDDSEEDGDDDAAEEQDTDVEQLDIFAAFDLPDDIFAPLEEPVARQPRPTTPPAEPTQKQLAARLQSGRDARLPDQPAQPPSLVDAGKTNGTVHIVRPSDWEPAIGDLVLINGAGEPGVLHEIDGSDYLVRVRTAQGAQLRKCIRFQLSQAPAPEHTAPEHTVTEHTAPEHTITERTETLRTVQPGDSVVAHGKTYTLRVDVENGGHVYLDNEEGIPVSAMIPASLHHYGCKLPDNVAAQVEQAIVERNERHAKERAEWNGPLSEPQEAVWPGKKFTFSGRDYQIGHQEFSGVGHPYDQVTMRTNDVTPGMAVPLSRNWGSVTEFIHTTGLRFVPSRNYTREDILAIRRKIAEGQMVLLSDRAVGVPTIGDMPGDADHVGYGVFRLRRPDLEFTFCAGGAMQHQGAISYTTISVSRGNYDYPFDEALTAIDWWLGLPEPPATAAPQVTVAEVAVDAGRPAPQIKIVEMAINEEGVPEAAPSPAQPPATQPPEAPSPEAPSPATPSPEAPSPATPSPATPSPATQSPATQPGADDFFANWDLQATQTGAHNALTVLAISPNKGGKKNARAVGQLDSFTRVRNPIAKARGLQE